LLAAWTQIIPLPAASRRFSIASVIQRSRRAPPCSRSILDRSFPRKIGKSARLVEPWLIFACLPPFLRRERRIITGGIKRRPPLRNIRRARGAPIFIVRSVRARARAFDSPLPPCFREPVLFLLVSHNARLTSARSRCGSYPRQDTVLSNFPLLSFSFFSLRRPPFSLARSLSLSLSRLAPSRKTESGRETYTCHDYSRACIRRRTCKSPHARGNPFSRFDFDSGAHEGPGRFRCSSLCRGCRGCRVNGERGSVRCWRTEMIIFPLIEPRAYSELVAFGHLSILVALGASPLLCLCLCLS